MLDEMGKRLGGNLWAVFSCLSCGGRHEGWVRHHMSINFLADGEPGVDMLIQVEKLMRVAAEELVIAVNSVKHGKLEDAKSAATAVRDLRAAYFLVMDERGKVEKLRKQVAGAAGTGTLDLSAARDEIGRRLARLRDAAAG